jgi:hypothetical protein
MPERRPTPPPEPPKPAKPEEEKPEETNHEFDSELPGPFEYPPLVEEDD